MTPDQPGPEGQEPQRPGTEPEPADTDFPTPVPLPILDRSRCIEIAASLAERGHWWHAARIGATVLAEDPSDLDLGVEVASWYTEADSPHLAMPLVSRVLLELPEHPEALAVQARCLVRLDSVSEAVKSAAIARERRDSDLVRIAHAEALAASGSPEQASDELDHVVASRPRSISVHLARARVMAWTGNEIGRLEALKTAADVAPHLGFLPLVSLGTDRWLGFKRRFTPWGRKRPKARVYLHQALSSLPLIAAKSVDALRLQPQNGYAWAHLEGIARAVPPHPWIRSAWLIPIAGVVGLVLGNTVLEDGPRHALQTMLTATFISVLLSRPESRARRRIEPGLMPWIEYAVATSEASTHDAPKNPDGSMADPPAPPPDSVLADRARCWCPSTEELLGPIAIEYGQLHLAHVRSPGGITHEFRCPRTRMDWIGLDGTAELPAVMVRLGTTAPKERTPPSTGHYL